MKVKRTFSYIFLFIVLLLGLSFAALNAESVTFNYYVGKTTMALSLLLVYTLGVGLLLGILTLLFPLLRAKRENRALKNAIAKAATLSANMSATPPK